jgi:indole-3-glycerol phosphate synthase
MAARRFSQAISEGDGISVLVDVYDADSARAAEVQGAEALVVAGPIAVVRGATELPILCRATDSLERAALDGADACLLVVDAHSEDGDRLEQLYAEASEFELDCVVEVRSEEELQLALERLDPEIFLLARAREDGGDAVDVALDLLPDVPAGKLAVAEVAISTRDEVVELERAGFDAVIVGARDVAELVGHAPPQV